MNADDITSTALAVSMTNAALTLTFQTTPGETLPPTSTGTAVPPGVTVTTPAGTQGTVKATTPSFIPTTGFFEDLGIAKGGAGGLGVVGLAALALVGVIVMARVLRART
jgi:hypothetical protein